MGADQTVLSSAAPSASHAVPCSPSELNEGDWITFPGQEEPVEVYVDDVGVLCVWADDLFGGGFSEFSRPDDFAGHMPLNSQEGILKVNDQDHKPPSTSTDGTAQKPRNEPRLTTC